MVLISDISGVHQLEDRLTEAVVLYETSLKKYQEILEIDKFIEETVGEAKILEASGAADGDSDDDSDVKIIRRILEIYDVGFEPPALKIEEPKPKKMKMADSLIDPLIEAERKAIDKDKALQLAYSKKQARIAFKPMKMLGTQELHIKLHMRNVKEKLGVGMIEEILIEELKNIMNDYYGKEVGLKHF